MLRDEYIKVKDVIQLLGLDRGGERKAYSVAMVVQALEKAAKADAVEVTRCKDCFYCVKTPRIAYPRCTCPEKSSHPVTADGYCNFGKPKEHKRHGT